MKRNKPLCKHRRPGTQNRRRQGYPGYSDYERGSETWTLLVPQSVVGADARTFDLTGAVPAGEDNKPDDPTYLPWIYRWRLDRDGRTLTVYATAGDWTPWNPGYRFDPLPRTGDVWYAFTAQAHCDRPKCPLTRYYYSDSDAEIARHRPGWCPLGIPLDSSWKYVGRKTL